MSSLLRLYINERILLIKRYSELETVVNYASYGINTDKEKDKLFYLGNIINKIEKNIYKLILSSIN